ncbi:hypothetical protein AMTRI_Chr09g13540 [Amborella trichopoda]|uniref:Uncharacterized protein n=1 Tax=Amborella trichopoda TaxID=13333 RepID=U5D9J1_AMBTC|nr:uncharacterized protein LOC18445369 [Amborella trichopoda]XP_011627485.1 uncharacterized protein LOC18445369 [Amborella trichopoda]ERN17038.1 hypothetical protein AMTR_s00044p00028210 [Amborella trichopoda]|eukprot:XP_006855571.1 uncharacterized protein LOC18445369 [Amborella trichopoda]
MSTPYERAKAGRLTFKGDLGPAKTLDKKKAKKKKKKKKNQDLDQKVAELNGSDAELLDENGEKNGKEMAGEIYTIDAAKKMKYDQLFPVEAKKFGYDAPANYRSVEDALDDRAKKKADRYCK